MSACAQCGRGLTFNEIGANKKFVSRHSTQYLCKSCLYRVLKTLFLPRTKHLEFYNNGRIRLLQRLQHDIITSEAALPIGG